MQVLLSTMNNSYDVLQALNIQTDVVVVNQCQYDNEEIFDYRGNTVRWINADSRGLSKSRNVAIKNSSDDICLLADDDLVYIDGYQDIIYEQFEKYAQADVIAFIVEGIEGPFKKYPKKKKYLNLITSMKVSSVQIAFRHSSLINNNISFKEDFGAGAFFYAGEESIFLSDCLKQGLSIMYVPIKIADLHLGESSWFEGFNEHYFITKGAAFTAMSYRLSIPLIVQFALRKRKTFRRQYPLVEAIKSMLKGRKIYLHN